MHETLIARPLEAPVAPETVTPIKPSEALRLGRLHRPWPIRGFMFGHAGLGACALGAIAIGLGFDADAYEEGSLNQALNGDFSIHGALPPFIKSRIIELFDTEHWSDDQIVGWLERLGL